MYFFIFATKKTSNMTTDKNKGITIIYNQLNLPQQIDFSDDARLINIYTADSTKKITFVFLDSQSLYSIKTRQ